MTPVFVTTFSDVLILIALVIFLFFVCAFYAKQAWKQSRCKHDGGVSETMACDAICKQCGKNLGFIGKWREAAHGIKETEV